MSATSNPNSTPEIPTDNTETDKLDNLNQYNNLYIKDGKKSYSHFLIYIIIIIIICLNVFILHLMIYGSINTNAVALYSIMATIVVLGIGITLLNDNFLNAPMLWLLPTELQNEVSTNHKILANTILLYSLDYIEKTTIDNKVHIIALKKKKELEVYKNSLNNKFNELSKKYLDIVIYEVNNK